jgi:putative endonuclease
LLWEQEVGGSNPLAPTNISFYQPQNNLLITLYVLKGKAGKRYVGITNNLSRRLREHHRHHSKAGQLIGEFIVIHTESFTDHKSARLREKFLKSGKGRKWLDMLESTSEPATKPAGKASL